MKNNIAYYCEKRGISQNELAVKTGSAKASVSRWINGESEPKIGNALKIAKALETSVYALFEEDDE